LARAAEGEGGQNPYLCTLEGVWSFQQVLEDATRAAAFFLAHGGEVGERVVLAMGDRAEMVVAFWAALWAGMVAVPVAPSFSARELREILVDSGARLALGDATSAKALASAAE
ncbi:MAG: AMP-binding protein, partial [Thermoanaerobaculum sp.]